MQRPATWAGTVLGALRCPAPLVALAQRPTPATRCALGHAQRATTVPRDQCRPRPSPVPPLQRTTAHRVRLHLLRQAVAGTPPLAPCPRRPSNKTKRCALWGPTAPWVLATPAHLDSTGARQAWSPQHAAEGARWGTSAPAVPVPPPRPPVAPPTCTVRLVVAPLWLLCRARKRWGVAGPSPEAPACPAPAAFSASTAPQRRAPVGATAVPNACLHPTATACAPQGSIVHLAPPRARGCPAVAVLTATTRRPCSVPRAPAHPLP